MPHYLCKNCNQRFESNRAYCATCKLDPAKAPRFANLLVEIHLIHFDAPHPYIKRRGKGHLACRPNVPVYGSRATGQASVVTCPLCRETEDWKRAYLGDPKLLGHGPSITCEGFC